MAPTLKKSKNKIKPKAKVTPKVKKAKAVPKFKRIDASEFSAKIGEFNRTGTLTKSIADDVDDLIEKAIRMPCFRGMTHKCGQNIIIVPYPFRDEMIATARARCLSALMKKQVCEETAFPYLFTVAVNGLRGTIQKEKKEYYRRNFIENCNEIARLKVLQFI